MKGVKLVLVIMVLLGMAGIALAQDGELHGSVDFTYQSKYIWRGFDVFADDEDGIQPSITLDLFGTGFGLNVAGHRAVESGFENSERWDYTLYYADSMFAGETYATNYMIAYRYYNYPDNTSHTAENSGNTLKSIDLQEAHALLSWPDILQVEGLVPSYCLVKMWPSNSGTTVGADSSSTGTASGWAHIFMLDYGWNVTCPITGGERVMNLHSEFIFNDGVSPTGSNVDHDWSNAVVGVSTDFDLGNDLTFTPGVFYQSSWDDSVNNEDETWFNLSLRYDF
jgi:hypothetical protein